MDEIEEAAPPKVAKPEPDAKELSGAVKALFGYVVVEGRHLLTGTAKRGLSIADEYLSLIDEGEAKKKPRKKKASAKER